MTRAQISLSIVVLGMVTLVVGVFGLFGVWWALILGGTLAVAGAFLLIDVDEPRPPNERSVRR